MFVIMCHKCFPRQIEYTFEAIQHSTHRTRNGFTVVTTSMFALSFSISVIVLGKKPFYIPNFAPLSFVSFLRLSTLVM